MRLSWSYARAQVVRNYLESRYPFQAKNVGVMPLSATPPTGAGGIEVGRVYASWSLYESSLLDGDTYRVAKGQAGSELDQGSIKDKR